MPIVTAQPTLVLMAGLPGSGKSALASAVGRRLGWPILDKDTVKSGLLGLGATERLSGQASYVLLSDLARDFVVKQRLSVILDTGAFYPPDGSAGIVEVTRETVREAGARMKVILCLASQDVRLRRLAERERQISQPGPYDARSYRETKGDGRELFRHLPESTLAIGTERDVETLADQAVAYILTGLREP